jgi:hypothetical protein
MEPLSNSTFEFSITLKIDIYIGDSSDKSSVVKEQNTEYQLPLSFFLHGLSERCAAHQYRHP